MPIIGSKLLLEITLFRDSKPDTLGKSLFSQIPLAMCIEQQKLISVS